MRTHDQTAAAVNPSAVRVAPDGRVALRLDEFPDEMRWLQVVTVSGVLNVAILSDADVADWTAVWPRPVAG